MPKVTGYCWMVVKAKAAVRRAKKRKLIRHQGLRAPGHPADQGRMDPRADRRAAEDRGRSAAGLPGDASRFVRSKEGLKENLWWHLPERRRKRRPRHARRRRAPKFRPENSILFRPDDGAHRRQFGHWEADLIQFRRRFGRRNLTSLVERVSRLKVLLPNVDRRTTPIMARLAEVLGSLPFGARRSVTFDRGSEFIDGPHLQAHAGVETWLGRSALALSEGHGREHQPPHAALAAARHGPGGGLKPRVEGDLRPPERHPPPVPRVAEGSAPGGGVGV